MTSVYRPTRKYIIHSSKKAATRYKLDFFKKESVFGAIDTEPKINPEIYLDLPSSMYMFINGKWSLVKDIDWKWGCSAVSETRIALHAIPTGPEKERAKPLFHDVAYGTDYYTLPSVIWPNRQYGRVFVYNLDLNSLPANAVTLLYSNYFKPDYVSSKETVQGLEIYNSNVYVLTSKTSNLICEATFYGRFFWTIWIVTLMKTLMAEHTK